MKWVAAMMLVAGLWMAWTGPRPLELQRAQGITEREVFRLLASHERTGKMTQSLRKAKAARKARRVAVQGRMVPEGFPLEVLVLKEPISPSSMKPGSEDLTSLEKKLLESIRAAHEEDEILAVWCDELDPLVMLVRSALRKVPEEDFSGLIMVVLAEKSDEPSLRVAVAGSGIEAVSATHY